MSLVFSRRRLLAAALALGAKPASLRLDQGAPSGPLTRPDAPGSSLKTVDLASEALRGNLIGDPHLRQMAVLLPPSYFAEPARRYPAVYLLHGVGKRRDGHLQSMGTLEALFGSMKAGKLTEAILVAVDGTTLFGGGYYASSPTIGNFSDYVAREVVQRVDSLFRTRPAREARAVAGFSMGGHGALKLAMQYGEVFSRAGSLSGSPISIRARKPVYLAALQGHRPPATVTELLEQITFERNWPLAAAYAKAAAFSPNPGKPPFFLDLPFESSSGDDDPVWQKWLDADPLAMVGQRRQELGALDQLYFDQGDSETTLGTEDFDRELVRFGISHAHYVFKGGHSDKLFERLARMLRVLTEGWGDR